MQTLEHLQFASTPPPSAQRSIPAAARLLLGLLRRLDHGSLVVMTPNGEQHAFGRTMDAVSRRDAAVLHVRDWRMAADVLRRGDIGFAESHIAGRWDTPDLVALLRLLAANQPSLERTFHASGIARLWLRARHMLNANHKPQARRNIAAHYDLGNEFYRLWLDETMTYSSAWFGGDRSLPLAQAQEAKYRRVLESLQLAPGAHILEVGCGWGGFAELAAREGFRVTGLSLSAAQVAYARDRIARAGLSDRVAIRLQDYRDEQGRYDGVVSIEMVEAVGESYWPSYFRTLARSLPRGARACLQAITIAEERFGKYRSSTDFIQQYIFPGGMLPSSPRLVECAGRAGLALEDESLFGKDYAETLVRWLAAFDARTADVGTLGFDERFVRCWRFYLAYCIAGFAIGSTDVGHYTFTRA